MGEVPAGVPDELFTALTRALYVFFANATLLQRGHEEAMPRDEAIERLAAELHRIGRECGAIPHGPDFN
jgi:hypothetical protein